MEIIDPLKESLLEECREDHIGLWSVVRDVRHALPNATDQTVKATVMSLVESLLATSPVKVGFPKHDGIGFEPWRLPCNRIIKRIRAEWDALGRDPGIGEIVWLSATNSPVRTDSESPIRK